MSCKSLRAKHDNDTCSIAELSKELFNLNVFLLFSFVIGQEKLSEKYKQEPKLSFLIKAIFTMAHGLQELQQDVCGKDFVGICPNLRPFNRSIFLVCI